MKYNIFKFYFIIFLIFFEKIELKINGKDLIKLTLGSCGFYGTYKVYKVLEKISLHLNENNLINKNQNQNKQQEQDPNKQLINMQEKISSLIEEQNKNQQNILKKNEDNLIIQNQQQKNLFNELIKSQENLNKQLIKTQETFNSLIEEQNKNQQNQITCENDLIQKNKLLLEQIESKIKNNFEKLHAINSNAINIQEYLYKFYNIYKEKQDKEKKDNFEKKHSAINNDPLVKYKMNLNIYNEIKDNFIINSIDNTFMQDLYISNYIYNKDKQYFTEKFFIPLCKNIINLNENFNTKSIAFYISDHENMFHYKNEMVIYYKIFIRYLYILEMFNKKSKDSELLKTIIEKIKNEYAQKHQNLLNDYNIEKTKNEDIKIIKILFLEEINNILDLNIIIFFFKNLNLLEKNNTNNIKYINNNKENNREIEETLNSLISNIDFINDIKKTYIIEYNNYNDDNKNEYILKNKNFLSISYKIINKNIDNLINFLKNYEIKDCIFIRKNLINIQNETDKIIKILNNDTNNSFFIEEQGEQNQEKSEKEILNLRIEAMKKETKENQNK